MNKSKVVIIEDDLELLSLVSELCQDIGCETFEFSKFEDFMFKVDEINPDLIITDRNLPGLNGNALIKSIRSHDTVTPILMISGSIDTDDTVEALTLGANDFISKPFNFEVFLVKVKKYLNLFEIKKDELKFFPDQKMVKHGDIEIPLTDVQFKILEILVGSKTHFASSEQLHLHEDNGNLEAHIEKLRSKLIPLKIDIDNIKNKGYKLRKVG